MQITTEQLIELGFQPLAKCFFLDLDSTSDNYLFYENEKFSICLTDEEGIESETPIENCDTIEDLKQIIIYLKGLKQ